MASEWYEYVISPAFGQMLSVSERKTSKIKSGTKKSTLLVKNQDD